MGYNVISDEAPINPNTFLVVDSPLFLSNDAHCFAIQCFGKESNNSPVCFLNQMAECILLQLQRFGL